MCERGISDLSPAGITDIGVLPGRREKSCPKNDFTEGIMTLADDKRPEATRLVGLSEYALQRQTRM